MATVPNLLSLVRILSIPVFVLLLLRPGTEVAGFVLLVIVSSTDWVDGLVARRTGQVSNLGKLLDPLADRLAMAAALVAFVVRGVFPLWAALVVLVRDAVVLLAAACLVLVAKKRIDVREIGKAATFALMFGIPAIAWGNFGLFGAGAVRVLGWALFAAGCAAYYAVAVLYWFDLRRALRAPGIGPAA